jgi:hypothetical protein
MRRGLRGTVLVLLCVVVGGCASVPRASLGTQSFAIAVDDDEALGDLIRAGGYGWVFSEINDRNFPPGGTGSRVETVHLVRLDPAVSIDKLISTESAQGLRAADLRELLAFGRTYPDVQRSASIVGFGSPRKYTTVEFDHSLGPMRVEQIVTVQNHYPTLIYGLFGRSVALIQEDMIPSYNLSGFFGCFVETAPGGS